MKALILNGMLQKDESMESANKLVEEILNEKGYNLESILLHEREIGACMGCFGCWVKSPGVCVIDDEGRIIAEKIIHSDLVIYLTPVVFGGYSSELKKALDRIIPLLLPFFKKNKGEVHHVKRYEKYPRIVAIGLMPDKDDEMETIFNRTIERNALNWYNTFSGGVLQKDLEIGLKAQLENLLQNVEVGAC